MLCDICKEQIATIHYTEILPNSEPKKMALCESCAKKKNILLAGQFSIADILKGLTEAVQVEEEDSKKVCENCGLTFARFRKSGRLGCPACYEAFKPKLQIILEEIHRGKQHVGKVPSSMGKERGSVGELAELHRKLRDAIEKEEFEEAALLRDRIQGLKDKAGRQGGKGQK